jgi:hypothetical protein
MTMVSIDPGVLDFIENDLIKKFAADFFIYDRVFRYMSMYEMDSSQLGDGGELDLNCLKSIQ